MGQITMIPGYAWQWAYAARGTADQLRRTKRQIGDASGDMRPHRKGFQSYGPAQSFDETWTGIAQKLVDAVTAVSDNFTLSADAVSGADHQTAIGVDAAGSRIVQMDLTINGRSWAEGSR